MTTLEDFFNKPAESLHPRVRTWKAWLAQTGTSASLEIYRPETEMGLSGPEMNLQFTKDGNLEPLETVPWDDDLNVGLIQLRVRGNSRAGNGTVRAGVACGAAEGGAGVREWLFQRGPGGTAQRQ